MICGGVKQDVADLLRVVVGADDDLDGEAIHLVAQGPVQQLPCNELLIGDDQFLAITVDNRCGPEPDP